VPVGVGASGDPPGRIAASRLALDRIPRTSFALGGEERHSAPGALYDQQGTLALDVLSLEKLIMPHHPPSRIATRAASREGT